MPFSPAVYTPDIDTSWERNPGAMFNMSGFAPLQRGPYGTVGKASLFNLLASGYAKSAQLFRQHDGTVRMLVFRDADIDEYSSAGVRTNRGTGYTLGAGYLPFWSAAAWGNQIIATNYADVVQSSTGAGFTALGGSPPKARFVAVNKDFVMLANTNDGVPLGDNTQWGGVGNPATWTASFATQSGAYRLREAPGDITGLVAFREGFVAFKDNGIFVAQYVGAQQYVWNWRMVSSNVGCVAPGSIAEIDNKLYFAHTSGVWEFDGQSLRNVSLQMIQTLLTELGLSLGVGSPGTGNGPGDDIGLALNYAQAVGDDLEGNYALVVYRGNQNAETYSPRLYLFNVRTQRWARVGRLCYSGFAWAGATLPPVLKCTTTDLHDFTGNKAARIAIITNAATPNLRAITYPVAVDNADADFIGDWQFSVGNFGGVDGSRMLTKVYLECLPGSSANPFGAGTIAGFSNASRTITNGTNTMASNTELECLDGRLSARFLTVTPVVSNAKIAILNGISVEFGDGGGKR